MTIVSTLAFTSRPLPEALARAKACGAAAVELPVRCDRVWPGHLDANDLLAGDAAGDHIRQSLAANHMPLAGVGYEGRKDLVLVEELPRFTALARLVAELGGRWITVFAYDDGVEDLARRHRALEAVARTAGLRLFVETHLGTATSDPLRALTIARDLGLQLCLDASHYIVRGLATETWWPLTAHVGLVQARRCRPGAIQLDHDGVSLDLVVPPEHVGPVVIEYIDENDGPHSAQWDAAISGLASALAVRNTTRAS